MTPASPNRRSTSPITIGELARVAPLAAAQVKHLFDPLRITEQVVLAETIERVRLAPPHALVVLHAEAASGGWSLAAALHLAWERNASAVVVSSTLATAASVALAQRLNMSLIAIDTDPVDTALQLAGRISAPESARALRHARCAELLAEQTGLRGILGVLHAELEGIPVAMVIGDAVVAGRRSAVAGRSDTTPVEVDIEGPGSRSWARLIAAVPAAQENTRPQVEALLRLARPSLVAAWAQTRLNSSLQAAHEQAAFGLLRHAVTEPSAAGTPPASSSDPDVDWIHELGWQVDAHNRAVWIAPLRAGEQPSDELTHLVRAAWQRSRADWPLVVEGDGWVSWRSSSEPDDTAPVRRALAGFRDTAAAHRLVIGVGRAHPGAAGLLRSVAEARLAAHVVRDAGAAAEQWFDQVGASAALAFLPVNDIVQVADLCLEELTNAKDRATLVGTVLAVLDCGGSLSQASERLGVHRNTVLARVARARTLGLTFDDPAQRLALHVLCYALAGPGPRSAG